MHNTPSCCHITRNFDGGMESLGISCHCVQTSLL